ncbi:MAG: hypothetical protein ACPGAN_07030 [Candidatus Poseidoniaceae archaeon]|jgi:hypothetical protein|tara:strand:- start:262 stop:390 length:129 start_codon:yes stop_codon:yes gene_type:complete
MTLTIGIKLSLEKERKKARRTSYLWSEIIIDDQNDMCPLIEG